jgi:hypothetical protein
MYIIPVQLIVSLKVIPFVVWCLICLEKLCLEPAVHNLKKEPPFPLILRMGQHSTPSHPPSYSPRSRQMIFYQLESIGFQPHDSQRLSRLVGRSQYSMQLVVAAYASTPTLNPNWEVWVTTEAKNPPSSFLSITPRQNARTAVGQ